MDQPFKKAMVVTDMHYGRSAGSAVALQDNQQFLQWAIDRARSWGAETCIFMGDWFDSRYSIPVLTLNAALDGMERLNAGFPRTFWFPGNHDLPYREKRDASSIEFSRNLANITLVRDPTACGDVTFLPWLVGDEHQLLRGLQTRYVFGHLELSGFKLNSGTAMPDGPTTANPAHFKGPEYVFSGHFHRRQQQRFGATQVLYVGSALAMDFNDADDAARGIMLLNWGGEPRFEAWPEQPLYRTTTLSALLAHPAAILRPKLTVRARVDIALHFDEARELRATLETEYGIRRLELVYPGPADISAPYGGNGDGDPLAEADQAQSDRDPLTKAGFKTVDQMVIEGILSVESTGIDPQLLVALYRDLAR